MPYRFIFRDNDKQNYIKLSLFYRILFSTLLKCSLADLRGLELGEEVAAAGERGSTSSVPEQAEVSSCTTTPGLHLGSRWPRRHHHAVAEPDGRGGTSAHGEGEYTANSYSQDQQRTNGEKSVLFSLVQILAGSGKRKCC